MHNIISSSDVSSADDYHLYELATTHFIDYAEKQRLIKLPAGSILTPNGNGLPDFPDETILVKIFYYFNDKRNLNQGRQLIETRLLIKDKLQWSIGTYVWNKEQTEATLQASGSTRNINWIDDIGKKQVINYHIPTHTECTTCHQANLSILPIGPKLINLSRSVIREGNEINQLTYFQKIILLNSLTITVGKLPDWQSIAFSLEERGRAYLDVNCSHCHNSKGYAARTKIFFDYVVQFDLFYYGVYRYGYIVRILPSES